MARSSPRPPTLHGTTPHGAAQRSSLALTARLPLARSVRSVRRDSDLLNNLTTLSRFVARARLRMPWRFSRDSTARPASAASRRGPPRSTPRAKPHPCSHAEEFYTPWRVAELEAATLERAVAKNSSYARPEIRRRARLARRRAVLAIERAVHTSRVQPPPAAPVPWEGVHVVLDSSLGAVGVQLLWHAAPRACSLLAGLASKGWYDRATISHGAEDPEARPVLLLSPAQAMPAAQAEAWEALEPLDEGGARLSHRGAGIVSVKVRHGARCRARGGPTRGSLCGARGSARARQGS